MYGLVIAITSLIAFPFIFPEEFTYWARKVIKWLDKREEKRQREQAVIERLWQATKEVRRRTSQLFDKLPRIKANDQRYLLLAQSLAAGQRFLKSVDRWLAPELYHETEKFCQKLESTLDLLKRMKEKKGSLTTCPGRGAASRLKP